MALNDDHVNSVEAVDMRSRRDVKMHPAWEVM
jgi:hypothetical protein